MNTLNETLKGKFRRFNSTQTKEECNYFPKSNYELFKIIKERVTKDPECDLNDIWVGEIADMTYLFSSSKFNGDISRWDVSNVIDMSYMFNGSSFNGDISRWDVGNVRSMYWMFRNSIFNDDISQWDVSNVTNMINMFRNSRFNGDISLWDVSNVQDMDYMLRGCPLEKNPPKWYNV